MTRQRTWTWLTTVAAGLAGAAAVAGPLDLREVAQDADWVVHIDGERLWNTGFGKLLKQELGTGETKVKLDAVAAIFGVDFTKDVKGLTLYGNAQLQNGVVLAHGAFNPERILVLLRAAQGYSSKPYQNSTIHHWIDDKASHEPNGGQRWGAFHGDSLIVMGNAPELVTAALDVLDGRKPAQPAGAKIGNYALDSGTSVVCAVAKIKAPPPPPPPAEGQPPPNANPQAMVVRNADAMSLRVSEEGELVKLGLNLQAKTPEIATSLEQALKGIQALGMLSADRNPELAQFAQALKIGADGANVKAELNYASAALFDMVKKRWMQPKPPRPPRPPPPAN